jgi:hypothetical protein
MSTLYTKGDDKIVNRSWELGTKFQKAGDNKASDGVRQEDFKIWWVTTLVTGIMKLKSWEEFSLTLSGHTHGMQFGIEIPVISSGV